MPLQMPIPGGPELLIILLVMALLVGVPVVLAGGYLFVRLLGGGDDDADVAELKGRIEELEAQVGAGSDAARNEVSVEDQRADADGDKRTGNEPAAGPDDERTDDGQR